MTHQPYMHFKCDRCQFETNVPTNEQPALDRGSNKPPAGWMVLWVDNSTLPARHLCMVCQPLFVEFMNSA